MSQLVRHRLTGQWLTTEHAVESTHLWMCVNGGLDLLARVSLASRAEGLAARLLRVSKVKLDANALVGAFVNSAHLDYRSPAVAEVRHACLQSVASQLDASERARLRNLE